MQTVLLTNTEFIIPAGLVLLERSDYISLSQSMRPSIGHYNFNSAKLANSKGFKMFDYAKRVGTSEKKI